MNYFVPLHIIKQTHCMESIDQKLSYNRKRSIPAAIIDGYYLYLHHFAALLLRTWPLLLCYSLLTGFIGYYTLVKLSLPSPSNELPAFNELWPLLAATVAYIVLALLMIATVVKAMQEHRKSNTITSGRWYGSIGIMQVPLVFKIIWRCLRRFWRYIAIVLVVIIITALLTVVFESSAIYLSIAFKLAHESTANGNPAVMPESIGLITFATFAASGFFQALIHTSALFPFYYAYKR